MNTVARTRIGGDGQVPGCGDIDPAAARGGPGGQGVAHHHIDGGAGDTDACTVAGGDQRQIERLHIGRGVQDVPTGLQREVCADVDSAEVNGVRLGQERFLGGLSDRQAANAQVESIRGIHAKLPGLPNGESASTDRHGAITAVQVADVLIGRDLQLNRTGARVDRRNPHRIRFSNVDAARARSCLCRQAAGRSQGDIDVIGLAAPPDGLAGARRNQDEVRGCNGGVAVRDVSVGSKVQMVRTQIDRPNRDVIGLFKIDRRGRSRVQVIDNQRSHRQIQRIGDGFSDPLCRRNGERRRSEVHTGISPPTVRDRASARGADGQSVVRGERVIPNPKAKRIHEE